eukprot:scaffold7190_cov193-Amphora_coffeaeformis.AAC.10
MRARALKCSICGLKQSQVLWTKLWQGTYLPTIQTLLASTPTPGSATGDTNNCRNRRWPSSILVHLACIT